jgi:hypothetical protein
MGRIVGYTWGHVCENESPLRRVLLSGRSMERDFKMSCKARRCCSATRDRVSLEGCPLSPPLRTQPEHLAVSEKCHSAAKVPKRCATNFPLKDEPSEKYRSMYPSPSR